MTDPIRDEDVAAKVRAYVDEGDELSFRLLMFHAHVPDIGGQQGILLRAIANAHTSFSQRVAIGATTAAEETDLFAILEEAMQLVVAIRDGNRP